MSGKRSPDKKRFVISQCATGQRSEGLDTAGLPEVKLFSR